MAISTPTLPSPTPIDAAQLPSAWFALKDAVEAVQSRQQPDGSFGEPDPGVDDAALIGRVRDAVADLAPLLPHDAAYLQAVLGDLDKWVADGLGVPDFHDSLVAFQPQRHRVDGLIHLVVFPMYTQNGSRDRHLEAVWCQVIWPDLVARLEAGDYSNTMFVPIRFLDFTSGYDTFSAVLFPETVAVREVPTFTWGAIFADREAARFRRVVRAACEITHLELPDLARRLLDDQHLAEETYVAWDLIHDRTHMRGDLPFDPFMIKQRMPYFLYSLEELRCDLTAFREAVAIDRRIAAQEAPTPEDEDLRLHMRLVQYCVLFDRLFRFPVSGNRVRNYDGLGGQLLFAWLHQHRVLHWTDTRLTLDWDEVPDCVNALGQAIEDLYWRSIDRPKVAHWLAAHDLVSSVLEPHPASRWKSRDLPLTGTPRELTDLVLDDEFPLSMFYEAYQRKIKDVIASTAGITGAGDLALERA